MLPRLFAAFVIMSIASASLSAAPQHWVTSWAASVQGPFPSGNASAQPNLTLVFPVPAVGANDQSFRLTIRPDIWGTSARIRFSNVFGTKPVTFDGIFAGVQLSGSAVLPGTNHAVLFGKKPSVTIAPGESAWSDAFTVAALGQMAGRKMAVSFHVAGESGPMTWHAKALTTSYVSKPGAGAKGNEEGEASFPFPTTSWYFLDALDMMAPETTRTIVAFGDSITDGTASTLNGDDRWPDVLSRRVHAKYGDRFSVVNTGIGGNQVAGPVTYSAEKPFSGGPAATQRLDRDVLGLSAVGAVVWLEGINDFNRTNNTAVDVVEAGMNEVVGRLRAKIPDIRIIGATVTSALGSTAGTAEQDTKRKALNEFIRTGGLFDAVADFDKATVDPQTGGLRAEFIPESTTGGAGDKLHPNRLGYAAMGASIDLDTLLPKTAEKITTGPPQRIAESGAREGPSWDPTTGILYFVSGNNLNRLTAAGKVEPFRTDAPGANGTLVDSQGRVLACEAGGRRVTRTEKDGTFTVLADHFEGKRLNSPNDLALDSRGRIYFTDPRYGSMDNIELKDDAGKPIEGVYRIDGPGKIVRILAHEVERPNGILVSPDDRYLYVADNVNNHLNGARKLWRFDLRKDGTVDPASRVLIFDWKTARGPDGFKMDRDGRLFVAAGRNKPTKTETVDEFKGGVYILSPKGELLEFVPFPKDETTNCAFGGKDLKTLFVTAGDELWSVPMKTAGRISAQR